MVIKLIMWLQVCTSVGMLILLGRQARYMEETKSRLTVLLNHTKHIGARQEKILDLMANPGKRYE